MCGQGFGELTFGEHQFLKRWACLWDAWRPLDHPAGNPSHGCFLWDASVHLSRIHNRVSSSWRGARLKQQPPVASARAISQTWLSIHGKQQVVHTDQTMCPLSLWNFSSQQNGLCATFLLYKKYRLHISSKFTRSTIMIYEYIVYTWQKNILFRADEARDCRRERIYILLFKE